MSHTRRVRYGRARRPDHPRAPDSGRTFSDDFQEWFVRGLWMAGQLAVPKWTNEQFAARRAEMMAMLLAPITGTVEPVGNFSVPVSHDDLVGLFNRAAQAFVKLTERPLENGKETDAPDNGG